MRMRHDVAMGDTHHDPFISDIIEFIDRTAGGIHRFSYNAINIESISGLFITRKASNNIFSSLVLILSRAVLERLRAVAFLRLG